MSAHQPILTEEAPVVRERDWLIPSAVMTVLLGLAALLLMPLAGYSEIPPYFSRFINWMHFALVGGLAILLVHVIKLRKAGVERPLAHLKTSFLARRTYVLAGVAGMALAGIDMLFFMWIKPEITGVAPFWADRLFADIDKALFFGTDPWRLFEGIDLTFHAWAYSFFWAVAIMGTLVWLLAQRPSRERSTALLSYFVLWSIFGTIGQYLMSAAGPIFYARIGLGDRFAELERNIPEVTQQVSGYLWHMHTEGILGVGAGISAMPSLHIATVAWIYLSFRSLGSRLAPVTGLFAIYIFALSVALGWHYAVDGVVVALGAVVSHWCCGIYLRRRPREVAIGQPLPASSLP